MSLFSLPQLKRFALLQWKALRQPAAAKPASWRLDLPLPDRYVPAPKPAPKPKPAPRHAADGRDGGAFKRKLRSAAEKAFKRHGGHPTSCFRLARDLAGAMGGDIYGASSTSARGLPVGHLAVSEQVGKLRPGSVVYVNKRPGTDPRSRNLANKPHWFTYMGKDAKGVMRFADQWGLDRSLSTMQRKYEGRRIDMIVDPYKAR